MKKFFEEFKKFITRGNVVDMAVGVTVGSAFTAIVNGVTNFVLKPIINWVIALLLGADSLSQIYTFLQYKEAAAESTTATEIMIDGQKKMIELSESFYIDWGSLINAVLNFFIIAFVLFTIVRVVNNLREGSAKLKAGKYTKAERAELKAAGIARGDKAGAEAYFAEKAKAEAEAKAKAEAEAAEAARIAYANSTECLLKEIRDLLKNK